MLAIIIHSWHSCDIISSYAIKGATICYNALYSAGIWLSIVIDKRTDEKIGYNVKQFSGESFCSSNLARYRLVGSTVVTDLGSVVSVFLK